jgi:serine/threonine protein kinase
VGINVAALVAQMCSALNHMHIDCRVMHRNLKPENMLLTEGGLVKICDLGLACTAQTEASMTRGAGTLTCMSPEKGRGKRYGFADDMWALGCIVSELATLVPTSTLLAFLRRRASSESGRPDLGASQELRGRAGSSGSMRRAASEAAGGMPEAARRVAGVQRFRGKARRI